MSQRLARKGNGFALLEMLFAAVILIILAALIVPRVVDQIKKGQEAEARGNLGAIRSAELLLQNLTGKFVEATDPLAIQSALGVIIEGKFYTYKIINASGDNFLAIATPQEAFNNWLEEKAIDKTGFLNSSSIYSGGGGSSSSGSGGGGSGGGSSSGGSSSGGSSSGTTTGYSGTGGYYRSDDIFDNPTYGYATSQLTSTAVFPPTGLDLTVNDGWLVLGFNPPSNHLMTGYSLEKAKRVSGVLADWAPADDFFAAGGYFGSGSWEDQVTNGVETCYRATTVYIDSYGNEYKSQPSDTICGTGAVQTTYATEINEGKTALASTPSFINADNPDTGYKVGFASGAAEKTFLDGGGMPVLFGNSPSMNGALAYHNPITGTLVLDLQYLDAPAAVIASLLAHETLHALWSQDDDNYEVTGTFQYGVTTTRPTRSTTDSIDQEYRAFTLGGQVWYDLRDDLTSAELSEWGYDMDAWMKVVLKGDGTFTDEAAAKVQVQAAYASLDPY